MIKCWQSTVYRIPLFRIPFPGHFNGKLHGFFSPWLSRFIRWCCLSQLDGGLQPWFFQGIGLRKNRGWTIRYDSWDQQQPDVARTQRIHVWYIYANIWGTSILMVNVTIYSIHGFYGEWNTFSLSMRCCAEIHIAQALQDGFLALDPNHLHRSAGPGYWEPRPQTMRLS